MGMSLSQCNNAAQTVLSREDIAIGITITNFGNFVGGTVFVSICQGSLSSTLRSKPDQQIPGLHVSLISRSGATDLSKLVPPSQLPVQQAAYNKGINNVFCCALGVAGFAFVASWFVEWSLLKTDKKLMRRSCHMRKTGGDLQHLQAL
jgi:hypothetical protein